MKQTILDWHTPEDEPMDGADVLAFHHGELYKLRYDGADWRTFSSGSVCAIVALEELDAWAYAPRESEVFDGRAAAEH